MALWKDVALRNMRLPDHAGSYATSYVSNSDRWWGRTTASADSWRARLVQGRYPTSEAFDFGINPDYDQVSYLDSTYRTITWPRIIFWSDSMLGETYQLNHTTGFINNTRVMIWGAEVWIKSKSTGQWTRVINSNPTGGGWFSPNYNVYLGNVSTVPSCYRLEAETGYQSYKLPMQPSTSGQPDYWLHHSWTGTVAIDPWDVADVVSSMKCSLVIDNSALADDRAYSRFMLAAGADYYPEEPRSIYPSVGSSAKKFVTARWPNWEYRVMHTMTQAQLEAANGYPSAYIGVGDGSSAEPDPEEPMEPPSLPTRGNWFAKLDGGDNVWTTHAEAGSPSGTGLVNWRRRFQGKGIWT